MKIMKCSGGPVQIWDFSFSVLIAKSFLHFSYYTFSCVLPEEI